MKSNAMVVKVKRQSTRHGIISLCLFLLGAQPGQLTKTIQRDIPSQRISCSVYKLGGVGWEGLIAAQEGAAYWSAGVEQLYCASLVGVFRLFS